MVDRPATSSVTQDEHGVAPRQGQSGKELESLRLKGVKIGKFDYSFDDDQTRDTVFFEWDINDILDIWPHMEDVYTMYQINKIKFTVMTNSGTFEHSKALGPEVMALAAWTGDANIDSTTIQKGDVTALNSMQYGWKHSAQVVNEQDENLTNVYSGQRMMDITITPQYQQSSQLGPHVPVNYTNAPIQIKSSRGLSDVKWRGVMFQSKIAEAPSDYVEVNGQYFVEFDCTFSMRRLNGSRETISKPGKRFISERVLEAEIEQMHKKHRVEHSFVM